MFSKILIANRGEVAVRIIRACKEMGINTVAVFSEADRESLHVSLADESICIGPAQVKDSYLNMTAVLSAAAVTGAQAIHPGYGLLSENARFARLCKESNITFIGPSADVIARMGDKDQARRTMIEAGVPVIPGSDIVTSVSQAKAEAARIGYPVLVKARSGGGGRGIRLVSTEAQMEQAFQTAAAEAASAFGDSGLYIEKYLKPAKHIEMQILCDRQGNVVCLGERECSVQRKNQKLLEESPSPSLSQPMREAMIEAAIRAAKAVGYENAGTLEFLADRQGNFYFMEMNTRLQVEHTVTEMVSGVDIVKWQIRIAAGASLDFGQKDVVIRGKAIECRINAEDPDHDCRPSAGTVKLLHTPGGPWVRFDTFLYQEYTVPPFYDSMVGKLIVKANSREEAIRKMKASLCELVIEGFPTNSELQLKILSDARFAAGDYDTDFMEQLTGGESRQAHGLAQEEKGGQA